MTCARCVVQALLQDEDGVCGAARLPTRSPLTLMHPGLGLRLRPNLTVSEARAALILKEPPKAASEGWATGSELLPSV
jgi:hypothetical protein